MAKTREQKRIESADKLSAEQLDYCVREFPRTAIRFCSKKLTEEQKRYCEKKKQNGYT